MKTVILILLFIISLNLPDGEASAQNVWYVDRDATGANTGRNWTDAWNYLDSSAWAGNNGINWNIISSGDTIYISGGTDSTLYLPAAGKSAMYIRGEDNNPLTFAPGDPVVVARAWHEGHNGEVIFGANSPKGSQEVILQVSNHSNIKFYGLTIADTRPDTNTIPMTNLAIIGGGAGDSLITLENCHLISLGLCYGLYFSGTKLTLKNSIIESLENSSDYAQDLVGVSGGMGGHTFDGNKLITRSTSLTTEEHADGIQFAGFGHWDTTNTTTVVDNVIKNNLIIHTTKSAAWTAMIFSYAPQTSVNWYVYNNLIVTLNEESPVGGIVLFREAGYSSLNWIQSIYAFNNTIIMRPPEGGNSTPIVMSGIDTLVLKNNLIVMDEPTNVFLNIEPFVSAIPPYDSIPYFREVDHNGYFERGGISGAFYNGERFGSYTWAQWSANYDHNSIIGDSDTITFTNILGIDFEDYYTETGRRLGTNIAEDYPHLFEKYPDIIYDILGNPRGETWDMGALQYQGGQSSNVKVQGKVLLQGPFNSNSMTTFLSQGSLLPASQPYNTAPWNYSGNEVLSSGSSIVDWVLVELRSSNNPSQVVARRAAVLKNDGSLLDTDGSIGVRFNNTQSGAYYIAVKHRNHLAVMSANPVQLSSNSAVYDFTNAMNKAFGNNPMADLGSGSFGMFSGDGNGDGGINIFDKNVIWQSQNGIMGYLGGDFDLDGDVTANDVNLHWNINNGTMTQVP